RPPGRTAATGAAIATAFTSLNARLLLPFVPAAVPLPGDRAFRRSVRVVDGVMFPLVRRGRAGAGAGGDLVALPCRAREAVGHGLDDQQVRDDFVAMFVAGTETSATALTWLWVVLDQYPKVAARVYDEIDEVVGGRRPDAAMLSKLRYTRMVMQEVLRLYPVGW